MVLNEVTVAEVRFYNHSIPNALACSAKFNADIVLYFLWLFTSDMNLEIKISIYLSTYRLIFWKDRMFITDSKILDRDKDRD